MKIGQGWDLHRMGVNRPLILGGIVIPSEKGEIAHSDGDVLIHSIIDAILGATCNEDIGAKFPDNNPKYKGCSSIDLLRKTLEFKTIDIKNIDCTIILQNPKLRPYIDSIRQNLAKVMNLPLNVISIKAKTAENVLNELGNGDAIIAQTIILLEEPNSQMWL